ncbi:PCI domain-containing protein [Mycotypha africana]|uniref:PCI domain-containing protein n=1 Tax=Mycotypha africana TaxID=64632 RepID=UPI0023012065|nr:PCI domain-containing protein [Mycotypha africana]KAI8970206.1 PCI domain-containing protein [Mycotypha africana]
MSDGSLEKMEKDFSPQVDALLPETEGLTKQGKLNEALEKLLSLEKQARNAADQASTGRILVQVVKLCQEANEWKLMNEQIVLLSKKHGQLKAATSKMIQEAMSYLDSTPDMDTKLELIDTLRTVTDGKIYVEVERARITRLLSKIREDEGKITEAADILQELQVETFGSMDKREKDLKLRYYELMIQHALHEDQYLNVHKFYKQIYDSESIQQDEAKWKAALQNAVLFIVLAPYDNEQSDLLHRLYEDPKLAYIPEYQQIVKCFVTVELMRWTEIEQTYGPLLTQQHMAFDKSTQDGQKRWKELHHRVVEHNIRVIAKYYTRVSTKRLTQLLDLSEKDTEELLSKLVVSKTIYARIDRTAGIINFQTKKDANEILNNWSNDINTLLNLIEKTCHLISKEEMVHSIAKVK